MKTGVWITALAVMAVMAAPLWRPGNGCDSSTWWGGWKSLHAPGIPQGTAGRCPKQHPDILTWRGTPQGGMAPPRALAERWRPEIFVPTVLRIYGDDPAVARRGHPHLLAL